MEIFLSEVPFRAHDSRLTTHEKYNDIILFSESNSRFIVEVEKEKQKEFERNLKGIPFGLMGCVSDKKEFKVYGLDGKICVRSGIQDLKEAWQKPLRW
jgi:phosphoribosylformylglycinamidine (FGAM) synthase-like enzyme